MRKALLLVLLVIPGLMVAGVTGYYALINHTQLQVAYKHCNPVINAGSPCLAKQMFAYIACTDGIIEQYRVTPKGEFDSLHLIRLTDDQISRVVADPVKRFAYVTLRQNRCVSVFAIKTNGALSLKKTIKVPTEAGVHGIAIDHTGRFAYVSAGNIHGGEVYQYSIKKDGSLQPLKPAKVKAGANAYDIIAHPGKLFVYVNNKEDGTVSQYRINRDGRLSLLKCSSGGVNTISQDGKYVYSISERSRSVSQYKVNKNGTLDYSSHASYANENENCCGDAWVASDPSNTCLLVSYRTGHTLYYFRLTPGGKLDPGSMVAYKFTRDNRLRTREEIHASAEFNVMTFGKLQNSVDKPAAVFKEEGKIPALTYSVTYAPDGHFYCVTSSGVVRLKVKNRKLVAEDSTVVWPDIRVALDNESFGNHDQPLWGITIIEK